MNATDQKAEINRIARLLIAEWERVDGPVTASRVANFADMARVVIAEHDRVIDGLKQCWKVDMTQARERGERIEAVEALAGQATQRAFAQIAAAKVLTVMPLGDDRAAVPPHWRNEAESAATVPVVDLLAALITPTAGGKS